MYCDRSDCGGPVKPDIVFFGENLPHKFLEILPTLNPKNDACDLLLVIGTALAVNPFN